MAQSSAYHTLFQNLFFDGKDKFAGTIPIKGNNTLAMLYTSTSATAIASLFISVLFSVAQYLEDDLQRILRANLDFRPLVPLLDSASAF